MTPEMGLPRASPMAPKWWPRPALNSAWCSTWIAFGVRLTWHLKPAWKGATNRASNGAWIGTWRRRWRLQMAPPMAPGLAPEDWDGACKWHLQWRLDWRLKTGDGAWKLHCCCAPSSNHRTDAKMATSLLSALQGRHSVARKALCLPSTRWG